MVLADPAGSILRRLITRSGKIGTAGSWAVEGIGEDFIPANADLSRRDAQAYSISDAESFGSRARAAARRKASSAARPPARCWRRRCATAASRRAPKRVVTFVCDTGTRYLSQGVQRLLDGRAGAARPRRDHGDLRDLIARRAAEGSVVSVGARRHPAHRLHSACALADVSQLPVLDERPAGRHDRRERPAARRSHADAGALRATGAPAR